MSVAWNVLLKGTVLIIESSSVFSTCSPISCSPFGVIILPSPVYFGLLKSCWMLAQVYTGHFWVVAFKMTLRSTVWTETLLGFLLLFADFLKSVGRPYQPVLSQTLSRCCGVSLTHKKHLTWKTEKQFRNWSCAEKMWAVTSYWRPGYLLDVNKLQRRELLM